jgi:membrane peptidoglycan carboxypeptidase
MSASSRTPILRGPYSQVGAKQLKRGKLRWFAAALLVASTVLALGGMVTWDARYSMLLRRVDSIPHLVRLSLRMHHADFASSTQVPLVMQHAIVAVEDRRFYHHHGIDLHGMARAVVSDMVHRTTSEGGATIAVQLVERTLAPSGNPLVRAVDTLSLAWVAEDRFTKADIINLYLNDVYFGRGAYGISAAAHTYFGVSPARLDVRQAAFLAALPQAPTVYGAHPFAAAVVERWRTVLDDMASQGFIATSTAIHACSVPLHFAVSGSRVRHA